MEGGPIVPQADSIERTPGRVAPVQRLAQAMKPPLKLPPIPEATGNHLAIERIALGQRLFLERRLSSNGTLACASCHIPEQGFTQNAMARSIGMEGKSLRRNASSLLNAVHYERLYRDGRGFGIDTLIWGKLLDEPVMGNRAVGAVMGPAARGRAAAVRIRRRVPLPREGSPSGGSKPALRSPESAVATGARSRGQVRRPVEPPARKRSRWRPAWPTQR
jgi:hypothetical protein